ncbi:cytochrome c [Methylorubrum populi]|uniref:Cytochrome c n=1 Tax=Methylobacterium radiotolerans TaxID=31998 RepID=A0ABU7TGJ6_9HYPH
MERSGQRKQKRSWVGFCLWRLPGDATRLTVALGLTLQTLPSAALDPASIASNGSADGAPACGSCHGANGEGNSNAGFPRLSGLAADYLLRQLASFAGAGRASEVMQPIASALSEPERRALASYYAGLPAWKAEGGEPPDGQLVVRGRALAKSGDWARGMPGCPQCHGPVGQGVGAVFPALAGQPAAYAAAQLAAWKNKTRANDPLGLMAGVAEKLTDDEAAAVSAYYASLPVPATRNGGPR